MAQELDKELLSKSIVEVVKKLCQKAGNLEFSQEPDSVTKDIIEFYSRMRVLGLEKFGDPCFISIINLYSSEADQKAHRAAGTVLVYLEEENAPRLFKSLGLTTMLEEDEEALLKYAGEFAKRIVQSLRSDLMNQGCPDFLVSESINAKNDIAEGVEFPSKQHKYSEMNFYFWKKKTVVVGLVMDSLRLR
jgi:hypothetical protein